jgi:hypothetical protein
MKRRYYCSLRIFLILSSELLILSGCNKDGNQNMPVPEPPQIISQTVTEIYSTAATLKAKIKTTDLQTNITFEYGTSINYGNTVSGEPDPIYNTETNIKASISSLIKGTIYHFRVKAVNSVGTAYGSDMVFTAKFGIGESYGDGFYYSRSTQNTGFVSNPEVSHTTQSVGANTSSRRFLT